MLTRFRSMANSFGTKLLLAFLVLTFAVWGIGDMVQRPGGNTSVATVGDAQISISAYQQALRRETENMRRALGERYTPELAKTLNIERRVLRSLIEDQLLAQESEALGLIPGDADVARHIRSNPNFQDGQGLFDKNLFQATLHNNGLNEKTYAETVRRDLSNGLILHVLAEPLPVPDIAAKTLYAAHGERRQATIYTVGDAQAPAALQPVAGELESFYAEHAPAFNAPEYRHVSYVVIRPEDIRAKVSVSEEAVLAAYKEHIDEFRRPERRAVNQLLYADAVEAKKAHALLQSGKTFAQVAAATPILNQNATDLGKIEKDGVIDAAADTVFSLKAGSFTAPIQSPFGWHIFFVRAIEAPSVAPLNDVRARLEKDLRLQAEEERLTTLTNRLEDTLAGGGTLTEAAKELGLKVQSLGPITHEGKAPDGSAVKLPDLEKFLETAFKTEEKTESLLMPSKNGISYLVHVDSVTPERQRALDEVRALVITAWQKAERGKRLTALATDIAKQMADPKTRDAAIEKYHLKATAIPVSRSSEKAGNLSLSLPLIAEIFSLAPGASTPAYPLPSGDYAIAVIGETLHAEPADKKTLEAIKQEIAQGMRQELAAEYMEYLTHKYPVEVDMKRLPSAENE